MNENPGETPNPLNNPDVTSVDEILDANPSEPVNETVNQAETKTPKPVKVNEPANDNAGEVTPAVEKATVTTSATVESLDPTGRSMERKVDPTTEVPEKKSKKGLIFAIFGCIFLVGAIAAIVAAVLLMNRDTDPVAEAMQKIMSGNAPEKVVIDGDINLLINDTSSPIKRINVDLDSNMVVGSMINSSSAILNITDQEDNDYSVEFDEIYATSGDLYFRIDGVGSLLEDSNFLDLFTGNTTTNCVDDGDGMTNCEPTVIDCADANETDCIVVDGEATSTDTLSSGITDMIVGIVKAADKLWIRISTDVFDSTVKGYVDSTSSVTCVTDLISDVNKNSNSAIEIYNKYPFIKSTDKNVVISSKNNPVYQISIDSKNFTEYLNAIQNTELAKTLNKCMGWNNNAAVTESDVNKIVSKMPKIYAEVNSNKDFTRLYLESDINNGVASATIDLGLSYPTNVNVSEPVEYTNYEDFIQTLFSGIYSNVQSQSGTQATPAQ